MKNTNRLLLVVGVDASLFRHKRNVDQFLTSFGGTHSTAPIDFKRFQVQRLWLSRYLPSLKGLKIKFKGKTIRSKRILWRQYKFKVGLSHLGSAFLGYSVACRLRTKQRMLLWSFSRTELRRTQLRFTNLKPINLYHARGIRAAAQLRFWKAGKVSAYR